MNKKESRKSLDNIELTERKLSEAEVDKQKRFLKSLLDAIPDLIFYKDKSSTYLGCNKAFANVFIGMQERDIIGKTDLDLLKDAKLARAFRQKDSEVMETGKTRSNEEEITLVNGDIIDLETVRAPFYDENGKIAGLIGISRDITERKRLEEALQEERNLFIGGPTIVFIWRNMDGWPVEYVSPNVYQILGYTVEDFLSGKISYTSIVQRDDREQISKEVVMHAINEKAFFEQDYRIITAGGEIRWFLECTVVNKCSASGEVTHLHGYLNDITDRKLLETKMAHLDRLNAIGEVAAGIGHEVRNPMTTVRGYLQLFQKKEEFAGYQDQFSAMIEELDRANSIITEFLSLAKNKSMEKKLGNLNSVIQAILPILQAEIFQKGHQLKVEMDVIPDSVFDEKEIRQLILNMVRNGLEAMNSSGVLTIKTSFEQGNIALVIQDTGSGIPAEVLDKLGTPFITTKDQGTGLGLSICYRIAARHGASIEVSTGFRGTIFTTIFRQKEP